MESGKPIRPGSPESGHPMESGEDKVVKVTNYFSLPKLSTAIASLIVILILYSYLAHLVNKEGFGTSFASGFFMIVLPTLFVLLTCFITLRKRKTAHVYILAVLTSLFLVVLYLISLIFPTNSFYILVIGYGLVAVIWYLLFNVVFGLKKSAVFLSLLIVSYYALFFIFNTEYRTEGVLESMVKIYISSLLFLAGIFIILWVINAPMKSRFGIKSTDAITYFSLQWLEGERSLEDYFDKIGSNVDTDVSILSFKRKSGTVNLIVPNVHFGPFGNLGGSMFPYLISKNLSASNGPGSSDKFVVLHGTATHDFNPVSSKQIIPLIDTCRGMLKNANYTGRRFKYIGSSIEGAAVDALVLDGAAFAGLSNYPKSSEDIDYGLGLSVSNYMKQYCRLPVVFDEHNSDIGKVAPMRAGDPAYSSYTSLLDNIFSRSSKTPWSTLQVGYSEVKPVLKSLGSAGIKIIAFGKNKLVLVVLDSNNIEPPAKKRLEDLVKGMGVKHVIISTTDTHEINSVQGVINPFDGRDLDFLKDQIKRAVTNAMSDSQPAAVSADKKRLTIKVLGSGTSTEIVTIVNSIVSIVKILVPLVLLSAIVLILFGLKKINL